jgi:hypothetical protein
VSILKNLYEALNDPKSRKEMNALHKNNTWNLIELPNGKKAVGCEWVFIVKHEFDGSVKQYKAILVAKVLHKPMKLIMGDICSCNKGELNSSFTFGFDVKNAFLYGDLEEKVKMKVPPRLECSFSMGKVCKLKRAL